MKKCLLLTVLMIFLFAYPTQAADRIEAWVMAQDFVQSQLKAPATAKFSSNPWLIDGGACIDYKDGSYYIRAYVDSQNNYGAMIRTWFSIVVTHIGGGKWKASDLHWLKK